MTFDSFPIKPQVLLEPDGRVSVFMGSAYKTMDREAALALYAKLGDALGIFDSRDARRMRFLSLLKNNHLYLTRNSDHAPNYMSAAEWIDSAGPGAETFDDVPPEELQRMRETNTIWTLQVYPHTPIGFWAFSGATAESVIDRAEAALAAEDGAK